VSEPQPAGLTSRGRLLLWMLIAGGLVGRTILAFKTYGVRYDIDSFKAVRSALSSHPLHVYGIVNGHPNNRWPYPPGFFPWVVAAGALSSHSLPFQGWIQLPQIAADGAIALLVQDHLRRRGAGEWLRLAAVALVALGPSFWIISGFHGQIDSLAILPAVTALWWWERSAPGTRRAVVAGVLIGLGASIKTVPIFMLLALLPSVRSRREAVALVMPAVALPVLALAPFLIADWSHTFHSLRSHKALPGFGGIGLLIQPGFADQWLHQGHHALSPTTNFVINHELPILAVLLAPFAAVAFVRRLPPTLAAAFLWSALLILNVGFGFEYVPWALPFLLMAGYVWQVGLVEAALFPPAALLYWHAFGYSSTTAYVAMMLATWAATLAVLVYWGLRLWRERRPLATA
jgi:Glycosyltransferase family 87